MMAEFSRSSKAHRVSRISLYTHVLALLVSLSDGQTPDPHVCVPPDGSHPGPTPTLPDRWSARIEANIVNKNFTTEAHEYFDQVGNRGVIKQWLSGQLATSFFYYKTGEFITVFQTVVEERPIGCIVQPLNATQNKFLFGITGSNGTEHIFSAAQALRFGKSIKKEYKGIHSVRGIKADTFQSCVYLPDLKASTQITWYFSANGTWKTATDMYQIPLRCEIRGIAQTQGGGSHSFHHVYEFTDFRLNLNTDKRYEIPKGAYCPNRKNTKPLPVVTRAFQYRVEIVEPEKQKIGFMKESYDYGVNLVKYEYYPQPGSQYGQDILNEIHDYRTGLAYISDPMRGNCSVKPIEAVSLDAHVIDAHHVRIRTSKEFFNFNNASYHYVGERTVRNIRCDVWTALRNDWPPGVPGVSSIFEWYFAQPNETEEIGYSQDSKVPVMLEVNVQADTSGQLTHFVFNIYDYDEDQPLIWTFDINPCFSYLQKKRFQFALLLPGKYREVIIINKELFTYFIILSVQATTGITSLRISHINIDYSQQDVIVSLTLLGVSTTKGDVQSPASQVTLGDAVARLTNAINSGNFSVYADAPTLPQMAITIPAKRYSASNWDVIVNENTRQPGSGYSAGVMGGVAVGLILLSFTLGFLILFIVYKFRGGTFASPFHPKKFDDQTPVVT